MTREFDILEVNRNAGPLRVDREHGVIHGCKLLGEESRNGYVYPADMRGRHVHLYEGAKCNIDHPDRKAPGQERRVAERFGVYRGCENRADGVYGSLHFNPKHSLAESVCWFAENQPEALAFSHNARGSGEKKDKDGRVIIESLIKVRSVDLVADGGTTMSLFEAEGAMPENASNQAPPAAEAPTVPTMEAGFLALQNAILGNSEWGDDEKMSAMKELVKLKKKLMGSGEEEAPPEEEAPAEGETPESLLELRKGGRKERELQEQIKRLEREKSARKLCRQLQVEDSDSLIESLVLLESEEKQRGHLRWLKSRMAPAARPAGPRSQGRSGTAPVEGAGATAEARRARTLAILRGGE
jgi:hypothetical protein